MNFFNKHKLATLVLVIFLLPNFSFASNQCSKDGYTVVTINGINTTESGAKANMLALNKLLGLSYNNQNINYQYLYNPTHTIGIDLLDSIVQKYFDQNNFDIQDSDFEQMLTDASTKVTTQKLLLVAHSQGNFYTNTFYDAVADEAGGVPAQSIGVYGVATPANYIAGNGLYITSDTDNVIAKAVADAPLTHILKPNVHIVFSPSDDGGLGHDFSNIYLKYEGDRIVSDIQTSLNKLQNNSIQNENAPCIDPPKLNIVQKAQGMALNVLDSTVNTVNQGINFTENTYLAFINNTGKLLANAIVALTEKNSATVVLSANSSNNQNVPNSNNTDQAPQDTSSVATTQPVQNNSLTTISLPVSNVVTTPAVQDIPSQNPVPVVLATQPTTPPTALTSPSNPYPNLLPGGGGVAATSLASSTSSSPPTPSDTTAPVITITGANPININIGDTYNEAGAMALDDVDGNINVVTTGTVDTTTAGTYTIIYTATDSSGNVATATRIINVAAPVIPPTLPIPLPPTPDTTPPVITILGKNPDVIAYQAAYPPIPYPDSGATATDDVDGTVPVVTTGTVNLNENGLYSLTYTATDSAGNTSTATRTVKVAPYVYIPKNTFGTSNGDGNDWEDWSFYGANIYDWTDTYVNNYLLEQFKIKTYPSPGGCNLCLERGIFPHDPQQGFDFTGVTFSSLEGNPDGAGDNAVYDVALQWDSTGYTYTLTYDSDGSIDRTGHTDVPNLTNDYWVGWDDTYNEFHDFPSGDWLGVPPFSPDDRTGGDNMILQPYPIYQP